MLCLVDRSAYYMRMVTVTVEIPHELVDADDMPQLGVDLRRLWAIEQVRLRRIGIGRAANVAGMPRAAFMQLLGSHGVPVIDYPVDDLKQELSDLSRQ